MSATVDVWVLDANGACGMRVVAESWQAFAIIDLFAEQSGGVAVYATGEPIGISGTDCSFMVGWSDDEVTEFLARNVGRIE